MIQTVRGVKPEKREIDQVLNHFAKKFGDTFVRAASDVLQPMRLSTGIFALDMALCGGLFVGKQNMFMGRRSSGKTTTSMKVIANAQKMYPDKICVFIDMEDAFDSVWATKLGVDTDRLLVVKPETGEDCVDAVQAFCNAEDVCLVVLDSIASLIPMKERDGAAEDVHVGIHAKLVTTMVRKVNSALTRAASRGQDLTVLYINQERAKIGGWAPPGQEPIGNPGGKALDHYTALQVVFKNKETISKDEEGFELLEFNEHSFKVDKNKFNAGIRKGEFQLMRRANHELYLREGDIDDATAMLATAKRMGVYTGGGQSWTLEIPMGDEMVQLPYRKGDDCIEAMYYNRSIYQSLRNHLIANHAVKLEMPQYVIDRIYEQEYAFHDPSSEGEEAVAVEVEA